MTQEEAAYHAAIAAFCVFALILFMIDDIDE